MDSAVQKLSFDAVISCPTSDEVWSVTKAKIPIQKTLKTEQPTTTQTEDNEWKVDYRYSYNLFYKDKKAAPHI